MRRESARERGNEREREGGGRGKYSISPWGREGEILI